MLERVCKLAYVAGHMGENGQARPSNSPGKGLHTRSKLKRLSFRTDIEKKSVQVGIPGSNLYADKEVGCKERSRKPARFSPNTAH